MILQERRVQTLFSAYGPICVIDLNHAAVLVAVRVRSVSDETHCNSVYGHIDRGRLADQRAGDGCARPNRSERAAYRDNGQREESGRENRGRSGANENDGRYNDRFANRNRDGRNDRYSDRDWRHNDRYDRYSDRDWRRGERISAYERRHFRPVSYRDHYRDAPRGYRYERNDRGDVLLIGIATGIIAGVILSGN